MDQCLKVQEQLGAELQKQIKRLSDSDEEHKKINETQSEEIKQLEEELKNLRSCSEEKQKLLGDAEAQISFLEKQKSELENAAKEAEVRCTLLFCLFYVMGCICQLLNFKLLLINTLQHTQTNQINSLMEQIASLDEELTVSRAAAKDLPLLKSELDEANQSYADLKKCMEDLERNHFSTVEIKSSLENTLTEKNQLISSLETELKELKEKMCKDAESHTQETENSLHKQKHLKEQLEAAKKSITAAKAESGSRREEIKTMKATLSAASRGLEERDNTIKSLKEKLNKAEAEQTKTSDLLKEKIVAMNKIKVGY